MGIIEVARENLWILFVAPIALIVLVWLLNIPDMIVRERHIKKHIEESLHRDQIVAARLAERDRVRRLRRQS